jgi:hypothetical protein
MIAMGWPTPQARDHFPPHSETYIAEKKAQGHGMQNLNDQAQLATNQPPAGWATPQERDYRTPTHQPASIRRGNLSGPSLEQQVAHTIPGASLNGSPAQMEGNDRFPRRGLLNPNFSAWLMGIPICWRFFAPTRKPKKK